MDTTIQLKHSSVANAIPTSGQLVEAELALNSADNKLFVKNAAGQVIEIAGSSFAKTAEVAQSVADATSALNTAISTEVTRAEGAEATLTTNLSSETTRAQGAETTLTNNLSAEVTRAQGAESTLTTNLASEVTRATDAENTLSASITSAGSALAAETTRAENAENALTSSIASEVGRAQAAETTLTNNLSAEVTRASNAENAISSSVTAEVSRAQAAEGGLQSSLSTVAANLSSETTRAQTAEAALQTAIDSIQAAAVGAIVYRGVADASAANVNAATGTSTHATGDRYRVSVGGASAFGFQLNAGDFVTYNGTTWDKTDNTDPSVTGAAGRVAVTATGDTSYAVDIDAAYAGQTSITTVGTIATGTWNGTAVDLAHGGTNSNLSALAAADDGSFFTYNHAARSFVATKVISGGTY